MKNFLENTIFNNTFDFVIVLLFETIFFILKYNHKYFKFNDIIQTKNLIEILKYLKSQGHNINNYILKYDIEKQIYIFYIKKIALLFMFIFLLIK